MYHALQAVETYDRYVVDAEQRGDEDLAACFREVQERNREVAHKAKTALRDRLDL
ncbi:MAG: hypothetical protein QOG11_475 [Solirubrobacteraceae bacterium]|nr:hypothetical protein [Solirubrobacteraceae bacterium]